MKIKKIKNKREEGFVLIVSLLVLAVSVAIGGGTVYNATKQVVQSKNWERSQQALYAAEAGVESAKKWLQTQYDDDRIPTASGQKENISCYENFSDRQPDIVIANGASQPMGKIDGKYIKDFIPDDGTTNNKYKRESLENYLYRYYISEANIVSGQTGLSSGSDLSATSNYQTGGVNSSATLSKFLTAICGEAPNNQRVFLEVVFRAVSK